MPKKKIDHGALIAEEHWVRRSPKWSGVEKAFRKANPSCAACGRKQQLQVHHASFPFHYAILLGRPDLELDSRNLLTLCESPALEHHLLLGHGDNFQRWLPCVREFCVKFKDWAKEQIKASSEWQAACQSMPKVWADMTDDDKRAMRAEMDKLLPKV